MQADAAFLLFLLAASFFIGVSRGKKKLGLFILAIYAVSLLFSYIPLDSLTQGRSDQEIFLFRAAVFLIVLILIVLFLLRSFRGALYPDGVWWEILLLSILLSGFLTTSLLNLAPKVLIENNLLNLSPIALKFFANPIYSQWWIILPIFGVMFL